MKFSVDTLFKSRTKGAKDKKKRKSRYKAGHPVHTEHHVKMAMWHHNSAKYHKGRGNREAAQHLKSHEWAVNTKGDTVSWNGKTYEELAKEARSRGGGEAAIHELNAFLHHSVAKHGAPERHVNAFMEKHKDYGKRDSRGWARNSAITESDPFPEPNDKEIDDTIKYRKDNLARLKRNKKPSYSTAKANKEYIDRHQMDVDIGKKYYHPKNTKSWDELRLEMLPSKQRQKILDDREKRESSSTKKYPKLRLVKSRFVVRKAL